METPTPRALPLKARILAADPPSWVVVATPSSSLTTTLSSGIGGLPISLTNSLTELFDGLDTASCGAYAMGLDRRILFWNWNAERILGHSAQQIVGRQDYEVLFGLPEQFPVPTCSAECMTISRADARRIAPVAQLQMRSASGERKRVSLMTLVVPHAQNAPSVLVHLFHERASEAWDNGTNGSARASDSPPPLNNPPGSAEHNSGLTLLTARELEVVRLLAAGEGIEAIRERLHLSSHTVLNHIRHAREKLHAPTRLALVLTSLRLGLA